MDPFSAFPDEVLQHLCLLLDLPSLCRASRLCRRWNVLASSNVVWRPWLVRSLPELAVYNAYFDTMDEDDAKTPVAEVEIVVEPVLQTNITTQITAPAPAPPSPKSPKPRLLHDRLLPYLATFSADAKTVDDVPWKELPKECAEALLHSLDNPKTACLQRLQAIKTQVTLLSVPINLFDPKP